MAGIPTPHVADREQRAFNSAVKQRVESQESVIAQLQAQIRQLQTRPVSQNTTVVRRESSGSAGGGSGGGSSDLLGALLPFSDPPPGADARVPPGTVVAFAGSSTPDGWLYCDGASYATAEQPDLFEAIGYTWGGAGANFNVPNLVDRYLQGISGSEALGSTFGATDHEINFEHKHDEGTLVTASAGAHTHSVSGSTSTDGSHNHGGATGAPSATANAQTPVAPVALASSTHTHSISSDGGHSHTTTGTAASDGAHTHAITGETGNNVYTDGSVSDPVDIRPQTAAVRFLIKT